MINKDITILIVEDDEQIRNFLCYALKQQGFLTETAGTGEKALAALAGKKINLLLLDLGMPDMDGMEIIKQLRSHSSLPIIVVSARDQDKEKVAALDLGADDYLTKPFSATELMARIRVSLRHGQSSPDTNIPDSFSVGDLSMDLEKHLVYLQGKELHMTPLEYSLLALLFQNMGKVLTTGAILKEVYGTNYGTDTQALRALMAGLRRKIEKTPGKPRYILTEIGIGYRLVDE